MTQTVIDIKNLSKLYYLNAPKKRIWDSLRSLRKNGLRRHGEEKQKGREFWALNDVSFNVQEGDVVGVVGQNGAGKSTLLKILSRITVPTKGSATIRGRVGSLLEVGTGFSPDLTGRENVYLSAAILGMKKVEIERAFDEIIDFASIPGFVDTPVKYYSSGMYMRLAFSVAAHLRHEILLVDEVLSVGDATFQKKCVGKINLEAGSGRTVLFVSHNMSAVLSLCNRAIYLDKGRVIHDGKTSEVVDTYLGQVTQLCAEKSWDDPQSAPGNHMVRVQSVRILNEAGIASNRHMNSEEITIEFNYWNILLNSKLGVTLAIYNSAGMCIFGSLGNHEPKWHKKPRPLGLYRSTCRIPRDLMKDGTYQVVALFWSEGYTDMYRLDTAIEFEVVDSGVLRGDYFGGWEGMILPRLDWQCDLIETNSTTQFLNAEEQVTI